MSNDSQSYYKLQIEFSEYKKESEELMKEYEASTSLLSESVDRLTVEKEKAEKQCEAAVNEKTRLQLELEGLKEKNSSKMKEIELLNSKVDQLISELKASKEEKEAIHAKVITLETDNDYYQGKMRENEALLEEQRVKMENALEDLIALQMEFDSFKAEAEEKTQRLQREIQEEKSNAQTIDIVNRRQSGMNYNFQFDESPVHHGGNDEGRQDNCALDDPKILLKELKSRIERKRFELGQYTQEVEDRLKMNSIA